MNRDILLNGAVFLTDGTRLPIVAYVDEDGDDCDPGEATVIVAGDEVYGYLTIELGDLEPVTVN